MQTLRNEKSTLRRTAREARKIAHAALPSAGEALRDRFLGAGLVDGSKVISGYCPIRTEIDALPLMTALHGAGHRLCVPVIIGPGQALRFRAWSPGCAMEEGAFGASIPTGGDWLAPSCLLVPMLAFDPRGFRLGYGGGFYDRSLAGLRAAGPILAVGLAFSAQMVAGAPAGPTDQRLDAIVTEAGVLTTTAEETA